MQALSVPCHHVHEFDEQKRRIPTARKSGATRRSCWHPKKVAGTRKSTAKKSAMHERHITSNHPVHARRGACINGHAMHQCSCTKPRTSLVAHAVQAVDHAHVGGQRLLSDHVTHKHHQPLVGQVLAALTQGAHLWAGPAQSTASQQQQLQEIRHG